MTWRDTCVTFKTLAYQRLQAAVGHELNHELNHLERRDRRLQDQRLIGQWRKNRLEVVSHYERQPIVSRRQRPAVHMSHCMVHR